MAVVWGPAALPTIRFFVTKITSLRMNFRIYRMFCAMYTRVLRDLSRFLLLYIANADIVCSRAKNHYDPVKKDGVKLVKLGDSNTLEEFRNSFKPIHNDLADVMYFSRSLDDACGWRIYSRYDFRKLLLPSFCR
ncbi:hypothetical protein BDQ17DRAFT_1414088 [Cyathus striatus]|nr:hypothetical protein BDQ17DRAFT_1414088 [Cyathus striatus]